MSPHGISHSVRPTSTGLLVEAGGLGRPGSGHVLSRGRALRSTACLCEAAPVAPPRLTALQVRVRVLHCCTRSVHERQPAAANLDLNDRSCHRPRPGVPALLWREDPVVKIALGLKKLGRFSFDRPTLPWLQVRYDSPSIRRCGLHLGPAMRRRQSGFLFGVATTTLT